MPESPWYRRDLKHPGWIVTKGFLFLLLGALAVARALLCPGKGWDFAACYALSIWAFCRFYYFALYVITHYVDPDFKYAGLLDFAKYWCRKKSGK